jgi:hypothetical protein
MRALVPSVVVVVLVLPVLVLWLVLAPAAEIRGAAVRSSVSMSAAANERRYLVRVVIMDITPAVIRSWRLRPCDRWGGPRPIDPR